jgi:tRNA-specific 2-thiouridylase
VFDKPDSQEICFVPDNDYAGLVERRRPGAASAGKIVDREGREVGEHGGQHKFTVGQRRGLDISLGYRVYVVNKDAASNTVTVGSKQDLMSAGCTVGEANWLVDEPRGDVRCFAKYRYNTPAAAARVRVVDASDLKTPSGRKGRFEVVFDGPQEAVAAGQAVVLYSLEGQDQVLGGGWIESVVSVAGA